MDSEGEKNFQIGIRKFQVGNLVVQVGLPTKNWCMKFQSHSKMMKLMVIILFLDYSTTSSSGKEVIPEDNNNSDDDNDDWVGTLSNIPNAQVDETSAGIKIQITDFFCPLVVFNLLWSKEVTDLLGNSNAFGQNISGMELPHKKHKRIPNLMPIEKQD
ncbi:hypothetical protein JTB14_026784 [Gonioctena quinquepunctata]|nr:hypothetical protein JTB14_026784 [Gonioctena quinquepunctata]